MHEQRKPQTIGSASERSRKQAMDLALKIGPERYFGLVDEVGKAMELWIGKAERDIGDKTSLEMATIYTFAYYGMIDVASRIVDCGNVKD